MRTIVRRRRRWWLAAPLIFVLIAGYGAWAALRPLPAISPSQSSAAIKTKAADSTLAWPAAGQSAVGITGSPILQTNGPQTSLPTASTAKLITALSVLKQKPLDPSVQGPLITLGPQDVTLYNSYVAKQGSVVKAVAGEQISEYQMLQAILLPSANNMADSLAIWAFGSLGAYSTYANNYVSQLGLNATHIGSDASGFAPNTTSSAQDLVRLGEIAMQTPVLAQIVGQSVASGLPIVNNVKNVNSLLGTGNIVGIKTGNTDQAGGVFVAAARTTVNNKQATVVTAVLGSPNLSTAMKDSLALILNAQDNFKPVTVVTAGTVIGSYELPWGGSVQAIAGQDLSLDTWAGSSVVAKTKLRGIPISSVSGQTVGSLNVQKSVLYDQQSVDIKLKSAPGKPSLRWRLLHPF